MTARSDAAKAAWTPERRERQREIAKGLVEAGKFGGAQSTHGRGGRPRKRVPSGAVLLLILEDQLRSASWSWPEAREVVLGRHAFAQAAPLVGLDRTHFEGLLVTALQTLISDHQLPEFVLVRDDGAIVTPPPTAQPAQLLRAWREGHEADDLIVLREITEPDVRRYAVGEIVEALVLAQFLTTRPLLRSTIAVALGEIAGRVNEAVQIEIERRALTEAT